MMRITFTRLPLTGAWQGKSEADIIVQSCSSTTTMVQEIKDALKYGDKVTIIVEAKEFD